MTQKMDVILPRSARTPDGLFQERVKHLTTAPACKSFDNATSSWKDYSWGDVEKRVVRWQAGLEMEGLQASDQAEKVVLERMQRRIRSFPGYAQIYRVAIMPHWCVEYGLLTPTMKLRRAKVVDVHTTGYDMPYAGH